VGTVCRGYYLLSLCDTKFDLDAICISETHLVPEQENLAVSTWSVLRYGGGHHSSILKKMHNFFGLAWYQSTQGKEEMPYSGLLQVYI